MAKNLGGRKGPHYQVAPFGTRPDGTSKGTGFLGRLNRPDGRVSTEISIGVEIDGKETLVPALVPTLNESEIETLLNMKFDKDKMPRSIMKKARDHALGRIKAGQSPFKELDENLF